MNPKYIISQFYKTLASNSTIINTAISDDYKFNRYKVSIVELKDILYDNYENDSSLANKNILVRYDGNPYITLTLILLSLYSNFNISFLPIRNYSLNDIFIKIINSCNITNSISICKNMSTEKIFDIQKDFDKMIYIGNVYNFLRFKEKVTIPIIYNGFGTLEVYVDNENDFTQELQTLNKFVYKNNIDIHYFHSTDLKKAVFFESKYKDRYCFIIYSKDIEKANKIASLITSKFIFINPTTIEYKFQI